MDNVDDAIHAQEAAQEEQAEIARGHALRRIIDFGFQVQQFKDGPVGSKILDDTIAERQTITNRYVMLDPDTPEELREMRDIRHRIGVLNCLWEFVDAYIKAGEDAQAEYVASEQTD